MNERLVAKGFPRFREGLLVTPPPRPHLTRAARPVQLRAALASALDRGEHGGQHGVDLLVLLHRRQELGVREVVGTGHSTVRTEPAHP